MKLKPHLFHITLKYVFVLLQNLVLTSKAAVDFEYFYTCARLMDKYMQGELFKSIFYIK